MLLTRRKNLLDAGKLLAGACGDGNFGMSSTIFVATITAQPEARNQQHTIGTTQRGANGAQFSENTVSRPNAMPRLPLHWPALRKLPGA
jgi:hypothetical protein